MVAILPASEAGAGPAPDAAAESVAEQRHRLRVVVAASLLGTTVEWYDFFLYATTAGLVFNKVFFPIGIACYGLAAFPAFALFGTKNRLWFGLAMIIVFGVVHARFYGAQGTLYSALYPTNTRYTGLSFVYQFSGIYASGVTPMILTALIAALGGAPAGISLRQR